jgi:serine/threonine-protein kinase
MKIARSDTSNFVAFSPLGERFKRSVGDRYVLDREIGSGMSSIVFAGRDVRDGRELALKILKPEFAASTTAVRFEREIRLSASLQHPNIVPVLDSAVSDDCMYLVMPLMERATLRERLVAEKQLALPEAIRIAREVALALQYAHEHGIIHRDIKPANILLVDGKAMVTDFGIAHIITDGEQSLTSSGISIGTPEYMSPEQGSGSRDLDVRSDVYALGCVLYEMLVGEPPFLGRTAQAVITRHIRDAPPTPSAMRGTISESLDETILCALAKSPADRFQSMAQFIAALDRAPTQPIRRRRTLTRRRVLVTASVAVVAVAAIVVATHVDPLDTNRVVIFPLREVAISATDHGMGEAVSTFIGYALESADSLKWLNGADFLSEGERAPGAVVSTERFRELARRARAEYFIDGTVARDGDSAATMLTLHSVTADSVVKSARATALFAGVSFPKVGLRAVGQVLPLLLAPGRKFDLSILHDRDAVAIAHFLAGERAYRRMHFAEASDHFRQAVVTDSAFALAALRGALAELWLERADTARNFVHVAVNRSSALPLKYALLARGSAHYADGRAAPAIAAFDSAIARDSTMADAWMGLAESYNHLAPSVARSDSLAEWAYEQVVARDSTFSQALFHLAQIGLLEGRPRWADRFSRLAARDGGDSLLVRQIDLTRRCTENPGGVSWSTEAAADPGLALIVAKSLTTGATWSPCADSAFRAVLRLRTAPVAQRWGALLGTSALMIGRDRSADLVQLLRSPDAEGLPAWSILVLASAAEGRPMPGADSAVAALGTDYGSMRSSWLWLLMTWHATTGNASALGQVRNALAVRADSSHARADSQFLRMADARLALARHDTATAERLLRRLEPNVRGTDLTWQPWEALAGERLQLAELLLARRRPAEASVVASYLDAPEPLVHVMLRRRALDLRRRAAVALGDSREAGRLREQLHALASTRQ